MPERGTLQPAIAGVVAALVGSASTFALVIAGLRAVGADAAQATSGLVVLCLAMGVLTIRLALRTRIPITLAWSTPGAALLVSTGEVAGGYAAALGAFAVAGLLVVVCGLWDALGRWIAAIPVPLASAMLAGVLLPLCVAPARALVELPWEAAPVVGAWAVTILVARRWAVPVAMAVTVVVIAVAYEGAAAPAAGGWPGITFTTPALDPGAIVGLAVPLFIVTMASQNIPGMAVLAAYGYRPSLRPILVSTGATTAAGAPFGVHGVNLAAITAALVASEEAGPDPQRRWIASVGGGAAYLALAVLAVPAAALVTAAPPLLIQAAAGLALLGTLGSALGTAFADAGLREAAAATFVVSASSIVVAGIGAPFWGLAAGLALVAAQRVAGSRRDRAPQAAAAEAASRAA